jgi:hypothetical protein
VASLFWSAVIGICAIATARFKTLCKSLEYWLTPFSVTGAKTDVGAVGMVVVLIQRLVDLIGTTGEKAS